MAESGSAAGPEEATQKRLGRKRVDLRVRNLEATKRGASDDTLKNLDSSLKKNTAFIKRLKTGLHASDSVAVLLKETRTLSLDKYLSEIIAATHEALGKCRTAGEVWGAVEVISALHQRFPTSFTTPFVTLVLSSLSVPSKSQLAALSAEQREKEETARVTKQRGMLRCLAELDVVGVVRGDGKAAKSDAEGECTFVVLKDLLTADKEALATPLPLAVSFAKQLAPLFLPSATPADPASTTEFPNLTAEASSDTSAAGDEQIVRAATKAKFGKLFGQYFEALGRKAMKEHTKLQETEHRNNEVAIKTGQIFDDRVQAFEKATKDQEKLWVGVLSLAEVLSLTPPTLPAALIATSTSNITGTGVSAFNPLELGPNSLWADEEDRRFYEDLVDLKDEVPGMYLGIEAGKKAEAAEEKEKETEMESLEEQMAKLEAKDKEASALPDSTTGDTTSPTPAHASLTNGTGEAAELPEEALPAAPAAQLTALFARLPDANGRDPIDKAAVEFVFLNSKAARKRLVKFLGGISRTRLDLVPYYARLAATLNKYMPDVGSGLISYLEEEFRYLQRKRNADMAETRTKNTRFLAELTKFGVTPIHSILHSVKVCVDDLAGPNIDNLCNLLEGCGRWLLRSEPTREKMSQLLDQLKRKMAAQNLEERSIMMLENAYYQCDPPDRPVVQPKERSPMEQFIRHTLYNTLTKKTAEKVVKVLRKLHWDQPEIVRLLQSIFTKVWKVKFSNVHLFAIVLHDLARHHPEFTVAVIDQVLEDVRSGMEQNIFKLNQQRVASVKYMGEFYNYRLLDSRVILDTLWSFMTFGYQEGRPWPDMICPIDAPDDFFRVRLVCELLNTCGNCFDRGTLRKRLDNFLIFFIMYLRCKDTPPMDIDFLLQDTLEVLRPKLNVYLGYEQASKAVDEMFEASAVEDEVLSDRGEDDQDESSGKRGLDEAAEGEADVDIQGAADAAEGKDADEDEDEDEEEDEEESESEPEEELPRYQIPPEEEDNFARELAKMMAETGGGSGSMGGAGNGAGDASVIAQRSKGALSGLLGEGLPMTRKRPSGEQGLEGEEENMVFTLLTKKGSKAQTRVMHIPSNAPLAVHSRSQQQHERAEQQQLKKLVLEYEQREETQRRKDLQTDMAKRGIQVKFAGP